MTELTEGRHAGEFIVSEANGSRSREAITVVSGQDLGAGDVVGKVTASSKYAIYNNAASDGTEVAAGILYAAVDASAADAGGVVVIRDAEVNAAEIGWNSQAQGAIDAGTTDLLALGIISR
ncbi:MAG: head decoration protein [Porticoccaceae bacterium]|nr:head decoration protein [Porticoccaceae bacterium]